ncbi:MAG: peptidoglycan DD-metalloendopeptidase family protein [Armatimonadetes bacterium]|nr:peptidoglycan DD-metalloendopeptidase family protein [Armatimonadota bacterium]
MKRVCRAGIGSLAILAVASQGQTQPKSSILPTFAVIQSGIASELRIITEGQVTQTILNIRGDILGWRRDGRMIAVLDAGKLIVVDRESKDEDPAVVDENVSEAVWSPRTDELLYVNRDQELYRWKPGEPPSLIVPHATSPTWDSFGGRIAYASTDLWISLEDGSSPRRIINDLEISRTAWSPDGRRIASVGTSKKGETSLVLCFPDGSERKSAGPVDRSLILWSPSSARLLVSRKKVWGVYDLAKSSWIDTGIPASSKVAWVASRKIACQTKNGWQVMDLATDQKETTPLEFPETVNHVQSLSPVAIVAVEGYEPPPFGSAKRPEPGQMRIQGRVLTVDPMAESFDIQVASVTNSNGTEIHLAKDIVQHVVFKDDSRREYQGDYYRLRVDDVRQDAEISAVLDGVQVGGSDALSLLSAIIPGTPNLYPIPSTKAPQPDSSKIEYDATTREPLVFEIVFPVIRGARYSNDFLNSRGGGSRRHKGNDLMAKKMTPLVAAFDGTVEIMRKGSLSGNYLQVVGDNGYTAKYMHMNDDDPGQDNDKCDRFYTFAPGLKSGDRVVAGQFLGYVGNSGNAKTTAPHCHFELYSNVAHCNINPYYSLQKAQVLPAPRYIAPRTQVAAGDGEMLVHGVISRIELDRNVVVVDVLGMGKSGLACVCNPTKFWVVVPAGGKIKLANSSREYDIKSLKEGYEIVAAGQELKQGTSMQCRTAEIRTN